MSVGFSRRHFLAGGVSLLCSVPFRRVLANRGSVRLPVPALIDGTKGETVSLDIRDGKWSFLPGVETPTLGFSQNYLGPTIRTRRNSQLNLQYRNSIDEGVAVHGHGLHVPGVVDGGPQLEIPPGEEWRPTLTINQPAATCWYHSHTHGRTGHQVYHGLAGMILIEDEISDSLNLPRRYGVDDLPIVIQDKTFDSEGRLVYSLHQAHEDGWLGDTVVINGAIAPVAQVPAGKVRLRLLNGANARFYVVTFSDNRLFHKVASDGGFLPEPVPMKSMEMSPGERCEVIVDMADGHPAELLTLFEDEFDGLDEDILENLWNLLAQRETPAPNPSLTLTVSKELPAHTDPLPEQLVSISRPKEHEVEVTRDFVLGMGGGSEHGSHAGMDMTINGVAMDMSVINEHVKRGVWERWRVRSDQGAHPFHIHGCSFLIEHMEGAPASPDQRGWKDTVTTDDDDWAEILVKFDHVATEEHPYMYHCHILEHEDLGMMGQFSVT